MDSKAPTIPLEKYIYNEARYTMLKHSNSEAAKSLLDCAQTEVNANWKEYEGLAGLPKFSGGNGAESL
jgi:pyruvate-ferredoxin/flavodoxin oxidoreductase